jgi:dihydropteroate synthase
MSLQWGYSTGITVLAPVSSVTEAVASASAGAGLVDVGEHDALIPQIRDALPEVGICGHGAGADIVHDAALAARAGAGLICQDAGAAASAGQRGIKPERILLQTAPDDVREASRSGWAALVDLDQGTLAQGTESLARAEAIAAVCAWAGAKVIRTRHVAEIRRSLDMTESILGVRRPAWTLRGLA